MNVVTTTAVPAIDSARVHEVTIRGELAAVRSRLLADERVSAYVAATRQRVSYRDFVVSAFGLFAGTALHLLGYRVAERALGSGIAIGAAGLLLQLIGIIGFSSLMHDAWHKYAVPSRRLNELIGEWITAPLFLLDFTFYRKRHFAHHRFVGGPDDPDSPAWKPTMAQFRRAMIERFFVLPKLLSIGRALLARRKTTVEQAGDVPPRLDPRSAAMLRTLLFHGVWLAAVAHTHLLALYTAYALPIIVASILLSIREYREHTYVGERLVTCDVACPTWQRLFIGGGFFNLHALHHVFPELSQRNLSALYALIVNASPLRDALYRNWPLVGWRASYFGACSESGPPGGGYRPIETQSVPVCPLCNGGARTFLYAGREHEYDNTTDREFSFFSCDECGLVYLDPRPADSALPIIYPPNYYSQVAANASPDAVDLTSLRGRLIHSRVVSRVLANIAPYLQLGSEHALLDVGCGGGRMLKSIERHTGCRAFGIDMDVSSEVAARFAQPPITLYRGDFLGHDFGAQRFDVIYASHLIEHLPNPVDFLAKCHELLVPGGLCVLETPNAGCVARRLFGPLWGGHHIPRHWFLLDAHSVRRAAERATGDGLRVRAVRPAVSSFFWIWTLHAALQRSGLRRTADLLFPSDHRIGTLGVAGLLRHGVFTAFDLVVSRATGSSSSIAIVLQKASDPAVRSQA